VPEFLVPDFRAVGDAVDFLKLPAQAGGDPALLVERREWDLEIEQLTVCHGRIQRTLDQGRDGCDEARAPRPKEQEVGIKVVTRTQDGEPSRCDGINELSGNLGHGIQVGPRR
jgi:hypothetical protein